MRYDLVVVEGWSGWGVAAGIIQKNLAEVGIEVTVKALPYDIWVGALERGRFDMPGARCRQAALAAGADAVRSGRRSFRPGRD